MKKTIIFSLLFTFAAFFANAQKFGIVNSQEIIQMLPEVKEASANIETFGNQLQKKYTEMINTLQTKYQELERKQANGEIAPKQLEEEAKKLKDEELKLAQYEQTSQQQIMEKQNTLMMPIMEKINKAIEDVAKENGYTYIFDGSAGLVLYADATTDVSTLVKAKLGL
jgi:outer membrane protein